MVIIYYKRRDTGKFSHVQANTADMAMEALQQAIERYNDAGHPTTAGAVEVADDSLEAYLFETRNLRADIDRQAIKDAIDALYTALDNVRYLED